MSTDRPIIVIGSGGHARVVADALLAAGATVLGFTDADPARHGLSLLGLPVLGDDSTLQAHQPDAVHLANGLGGVGSAGAAGPGQGRLRQRVQQGLAAQGWQFVGVRHPSAVLSPFAELAGCVQLLAGSIVQPGARLGEGCIVNTAAVVEHDVHLSAWCHVAPRALLCGDVRVGTGSHIGAGAVLRQGVRLGANTLVGAGAVVVRSFEGSVVLAGVPARVMESRR
ncbi:MAG: acetyltransferase [Vitreoscilla sp.]|nr:acetyltransferase [Vitreoscilla sp.]